MAEWQSVFSTLWVVWFFVLFTGIILAVMRPRKRPDYERAGQIPFLDDSRPPSR